MKIAAMLDPGSIGVAFQPIVDLSSGDIFAYEALVRCAMPRFRDPTALIQNARDNECIGRLGRMIRDVAVPLAAGHRLFVNVHPMELDSPWLARPDDPVYFHDRELFLEITEDVCPMSAPRYREMLDEIRGKGIHIVVDDLGSGYSNLDWLVELRPAVIKLDRALIRGMDASARRRALVAGIVRICLDLDATVVAEGIEEHDQLQAVRDVGVQLGQGYLLAPPGFPLPSVRPSARLQPLA